MAESLCGLVNVDEGEILMNEGDHHVSLTDAGGDAFDRFAPDVAGDEDAGDARFPWKRRPRAAQHLHVAIGSNIPVRITLYCVRKPFSPRLSADEDKQTVGTTGARFTADQVRRLDFEMIRAADPGLRCFDARLPDELWISRSITDNFPYMQYLLLSS